MTKEQSILMTLGVPASQHGFEYLADALTIVEKEPTYAYRTTDLYSLLAGRHDTTASRVERSIRHAVETAFNRLTPAEIEKWFGRSVSSDKGKPLNSAFIATLALWLKGDGNK